MKTIIIIFCFVYSIQSSFSQDIHSSEYILTNSFGEFRAEGLKKLFKEDLDSISGLNNRGIVALGAATIPSGKYENIYLPAQSFGYLLGMAGLSVRTGGGPGIMEAVPKGNQAGLSNYWNHSLDATIKTFANLTLAQKNFFSNKIRSYLGSVTQGVVLNLPNEPENKFLEVKNNSKMNHFPFRKEALLHPDLGVEGAILFPGGIGTFEEIFQLLAIENMNSVSRPVIAVNDNFYRPVIDVLQKIARTDRTLFAYDLNEKIYLAKTHEDGVNYILRFKNRSQTHKTMAQYRNTLEREMNSAIDKLESEPWAISLLGPKYLAEDDPVLPLIQSLFASFASNPVDVRISRNSTWLSTVNSQSDPGRSGVNSWHAFFRDNDMDQAIPDWINLRGILKTQSAHNEALIDKAYAYVVLPGDADVLMKVFTILDWIKMGQLSPRPVILVGSDYWNPLFETLSTVFFEVLGKSFPEKALKHCYILDDVQEINKVLTRQIKSRIPIEKNQGV